MAIIISLREALSRLELKNGKRYSIIQLSEDIGLNPRTTRELFFGGTEQIRTSTMAKVIEFFDSQDCKITYADFFHTVTNEPEPPKTL